MNTSSTSPANLASDCDVFGKTPIHGPLLLFKGLYYAASLFNFRRIVKADLMRKHNVRVVDETGAAMN